MDAVDGSGCSSGSGTSSAPELGAACGLSAARTPSSIHGGISLPMDVCEPECIGTIKVLVIEDDEGQCQLLDLLFQQANEKNVGVLTFDVHFVGTAAEAIATVSADGAHYHLILLDLVLPDKSGHELLPELRAHVGPEVAIVIATAHSQVGPPATLPSRLPPRCHPLHISTSRLRLLLAFPEPARHTHMPCPRAVPAYRAAAPVGDARDGL